MPPYGPSDATCVEAYWLWCDNIPYSQIAAILKDPPHNCKSKTSAIDWVKRGRKIEAEKGGPAARRRAERERNAFAIRRIYVRIAEDMKADRLTKERLAAYKIQLEALRDISRLLGLPAAPDAKEVKISGDGFEVRVPDELRGSLGAMPGEEVLPHLPDEVLRRLGLERKAPHERSD